MTSENQVSICNKALTLLGEREIDSITDDNSQARICARLYPAFRLKMLTHFVWSWSQKRAKLVRRTDDALQPVAEFEYVFDMPDGRLNDTLVTVFDTDQAGATPYSGRWEIHGSFLFANVDELWAEYQADVVEADWPPSFIQAVIYAFAEQIALPITQNESLRKAMYDKAYGNGVTMQGQIADAISEDGGGQPYQSRGPGVLIIARQGGTVEVGS